MKDKLVKIYNQYVIMGFFILLPFVEALTTITKVNYSFSLSFGVLYKTVFIIYCLIYLLFIKKINKLNLFMLAFIGAYLVLHGISIIQTATDITLYINNASRLISFVVAFVFFYEFNKNNNRLNLNILAYSGVIYSAIILIAKVTNTAFATYSNDLANGSSGWFYSGNEISSLFAIFIPAIVYLLATKQNLVTFASSLLVLYSSLVLGTKSSLVIVSITLILLIFVSLLGTIKKNCIMTRLFKWTLILTIFVSLILPYTESYKYSFKRFDESINSNEELESDTVIEFLYNGRQNFLMNQKELYKNSDLFEKLFGLKNDNILKYDGEIKLVELDYYDIVINYGIIGFLVWHFIIIYSIALIIKELTTTKQFSLQILVNLFVNLVLIIVANIAGHVLLCSTVAICFAFCLAMQSTSLNDKFTPSFREKYNMHEKNNKKKMLICTPRISVGGMERAFINLLNMSDYKDKYEIWAYVNYIKDPEYLSNIPQNINLHIVCNAKWTLLNKIITVIKIMLDTLFVPKFDVAICYGHNNGFLARLALRASKNSVIFIHADLESRTSKEIAKLNRFVNFEKFKKVVCVSNKSKASYTKLFKNSDVRVINNYIDGKAILEEAEEDNYDKEYFKENKITFISVARQEEKSKKLSRIIDATKKLKDKGYSFQILMLGEGPDTLMYKEKVKSLDLEKEIVFMGQKTNPYPYIKRSDALLFSSLFEGYGIVLDEARLLNIPFISTEVADAKLIAKEGFGITCKNSLEGIYGAMKKFLDKGYSINTKFDYIKFNLTITNSLNDLLEEK
ncbi:MAG: O-antigen ligase family protein [Clostridia bacterium]|nr:O-antigen ligase family protein [Clostridia bacterium]